MEFVDLGVCKYQWSDIQYWHLIPFQQINTGRILSTCDLAVPPFGGHLGAGSVWWMAGNQTGLYTA